MEEIEVPTEHLQETIHEEAHEAAHAAHGAHGHEREAPLAMQVALSSALIAVLAAVTALLAGHHANEAMIEQLKASDQWSFFQAKSIKATVLSTAAELRQSSGQAARPDDEARLATYKEEGEQIKEKARELEASSEAHLRRHQVLARGVTLFQIGIAMAAIAVLTRKRPLFFGSLALGVGGLFFLVLGVL